MNRKNYLIMSTLIIYCLVFIGCSHETPKPMTNYYDAIVYVTDHDMKYHRDGCKCLEYSKVPITLKQAEDRGLSLCPVCKPPVIDSRTDATITLNKPYEYPR